MFLLIGVGLLFAAGLVCLFVPNRWGRWIGPGGAVVAALLGLPAGLRAVFGGVTFSARWAWSIPYGSLAFELDGLSGWFLLPVLLV